MQYLKEICIDIFITLLGFSGNSLMVCGKVFQQPADGPFLSPGNAWFPATVMLAAVFLVKYSWVRLK